MPISLHQHIKITIREYYLICKTSTEIEDKRIAKEEDLDYKVTFQLTGEILKEIQLSSKSSLKGSKRIWRIKILWKYTKYTISIYRLEEPC